MNTVNVHFILFYLEVGGTIQNRIEDILSSENI